MTFPVSYRFNGENDNVVLEFMLFREPVLCRILFCLFYCIFLYRLMMTLLGLTLPYFTTRSILVNLGISIGKSENREFFRNLQHVK